MLFAGTDDGVYRLTGIDESRGLSSADQTSSVSGDVDESDTTVQKVLDATGVMRLRAVDAYDGVFAATQDGLYHSTDGHDWTNLDVPQEKVYAVAAAPDGRLYAGTRPAHVYVAAGSDDGPPRGADWTECESFRELPSQSEWQLPRHENLAQVRDLHVPGDVPDRVVAGVEVGGVHLSDDGGDHWTERRDSVDDDIHELVVTGPTEFLAATGFGLFHTTDAGQSWTRLDEGYDQRYFRSAAAVDGTLYAGAAIAHTATWSDEDADPALFACRDGETVERVDHPRPDETVTGLTDVDGRLAAATYRGTVMLRGDDDWRVLGSLSAPGEPAGSYTPLCWVDR